MTVIVSYHIIILNYYYDIVIVDDHEEASDIIISGWGDDEGDLRDDLLQRWSVMLEHWDGRDKWEPSGEKIRNKGLCKLVRCVSIMQLL